ncbi:hypothetical protein [Streptacidiphilus jiangxiensis]|uniref:Uncharacterized protein n=1 Tax=Streptacidiphilus jiangxiensis TaxID=235985 RepID=A0A1H7QNB1_STRJI|nr:hypothetical protein [Streptacidiphilus jiangxiensis]SEL49436.1 hypothetical protein SAMN05414137_109125 [Streptacidiphilus jiangxiensis]
MIADLTPADLVTDPADCLPIFEERVRAEQRRLAVLQEVVRELRGIEQARARLQTLLDGDACGVAVGAGLPGQVGAELAAHDVVGEEGLGLHHRDLVTGVSPVALVRAPGRGRAASGPGPRSGAEGGRRGRPGRHLDRAMEVLAAEPDRRFSAPQIAALIGADADWLRFVLHSAANRGLVQRHSQSRPMGGRGRPVVIQFSAARPEHPPLHG